MQRLRKLLLPFAVLYGLITYFRNLLFDVKILKSYSFDIPIIAVGNLSVGGTGKSPQVEYLIRLLSQNYKVATLSRGYNRSTSGFVLADYNANALTIGDEPFQFYTKYPESIVAVDEDRAEGVEILLNLDLKPHVILLDDAFQHRKVQAGFYILLTAYNDLFCNDFMLPSGNLREFEMGKKRANVVVVTKCPADLDEDQQQITIEKLQVGVPVYFNSIVYNDFVLNNAQESLLVSDIKNTQKIVLAGIAKPEPFFNFLNAETAERLIFADHHNFTDVDIQHILKKAAGRKIITTEKDFMRLKNKLPNNQLYYLPIQINFLRNKNNFDQQIINFVKKSNQNV